MIVLRYFVMLCACFGFVCCKKKKLEIIAAQPCEIPESQFDVENRAQIYIRLFKNKKGNNYIDGNYTIAKKTPPIYLKLSVYQLTEDGRKLEWSEKLTCKNPLAAGVIKQLRVKYDYNDCSGYPGVVYIRRFRLDQIANVGLHTMFSPGTFIIENDYCSPKGTVACYSIQVNVSKI